ncbi:MAG TPA: HAD-IIA family hydrolase [Polyangiales bacterium]
MNQLFSEIAPRYSVILFDAYGVLKNSAGVLPGVLEVLARLIDAGKELYVVTNDSSRSPEVMAHAYAHPTRGELIPGSRHVTSGLLATEFLRTKVRSGRVAYLGKPSSAYYIDAAGLSPVPVSLCDPHSDVRALALLDDEGFDWQPDLNRALNLLREQNIPVVVANADPTYPVDADKVAIAVGGLGDLMERIVHKRFIRFGKPDALMYAHAYEKARAQRPTLDKSQVLMVGDTLDTDVLGGNKFGIDTVLVLSGNTQRDHAQMQIEATGIIPDYVCDSILT